MKDEMKGTDSEFSRRVPVRGLPEGGKEVRFEATAEERAAVARRLNLVAIDELTARFTVTPEPGGALARGEFEAVVVQECVVTLEPVTYRVAAEVVQRFSAQSDAPPVVREVEFDALMEDPPESLIQGAAELGELVVEHLALTVDPYPRRPGAHPKWPREGGGGDESPFAKLRALKLSAKED